MTETDPTTITLIIGNAGEITEISAPDIDPLFDFTSAIDLHFGFNTNADLPFSVFADHIQGLAVLTDTALDAVNAGALSSLDFSTQPVFIDSNDTVVVWLQDDVYVVVGAVTPQSGTTLSFTYQNPTAIPTPTPGEPGAVPEPATAGLLGVGLLGIIGVFVRRWKHNTSPGGTRMTHIQRILLLFIFASWPTGASFAAEVQVLVIGNGFVQGEGFGCGGNCAKTYPEGTVVHLKAIPFPDSDFVEWKLDGESHTGILTIEHDAVVSAVFKLKAESLPNGFDVYWYSGMGGREYAAICFDEMVIEFESREKWGSTTEEEYNAIIQKNIQQFHPQAQITGRGNNSLILKSPEPLDRQKWFSTLLALQELPYIRYTGPVLYKVPGAPWSRIDVWNELSVDFPSNYTDVQIEAIEQEYGLIRIEPLVVPNSFIYEVGSPLEAIDVANRLYESGVVEFAYPSVSENLTTTDINDPLFKKQWHLDNTAYPGEDLNILSAWNMNDKQGNPIQGGTDNNDNKDDVIIAIVDDGVEFVHEDLQQNQMPEKYHYDYIEGDFDPIDNNLPQLAKGVKQIIDPKPSHCVSGCHGTAVAGVAAAKGNDIGVRGVAPQASLIGYRKALSDETGVSIYSMPPRAYNGLYAGGKEMSVDIYNSSIGTGESRDKGNSNTLKEIKLGAEEHQIIYVWGAGNIRSKDSYDKSQNKITVPIMANTNYSGFTNSRYTIAVGASGSLYGEAHSYSTPGATVLINAPSGIFTTDRMGADGYAPEFEVNGELITVLGTKCGVPPDFYSNALWPLKGLTFTDINALLQAMEALVGKEQVDQYRNNIEQCRIDFPNYLDPGYTRFSGTSAATPVVSGVAALMLQAQPKLGWRDVQNILIETAHKNMGDTDEPLEHDWQNNTNAAGYSHLYKYGFGRVDAGKAVDAALQWDEDAVLKDISSTTYQGKSGTLDQTTDGPGKAVTKTFHLEENLKIEFVEITFTSDYPRWGDLEITLTSPGGMESVLAKSITTPKIPYGEWHFGSRRHFGEYSQGEWTLKVEDTVADGDNGSYYFEWDVTVHGTELPTWQMTLPSKGQCCKSAGGVMCTFDEGESTLALTPAGVSAGQQVIFPTGDIACTTEELTKWDVAPTRHHSGTYWFPRPREDGGAYGIAIASEGWQLTETFTENGSCEQEPPLPDDKTWTISSTVYDKLATVTVALEDRKATVTFESPQTTEWAVTPKQASIPIPQDDWELLNSTTDIHQEEPDFYAWEAITPDWPSSCDIPESGCFYADEQLELVQPNMPGSCGTLVTFTYGEGQEVQCPKSSGGFFTWIYHEFINLPFSAQETPPLPESGTDPGPPSDPPSNSWTTVTNTHWRTDWTRGDPAFTEKGYELYTDYCLRNYNYTRHTYKRRWYNCPYTGHTRKYQWTETKGSQTCTRTSRYQLTTSQPVSVIVFIP